MSTVTGLVVGKFWPPHRGHSHVIQTALNYCDTVHVVVCASRETETAAANFLAPKRAEMLHRTHPTAIVTVFEQWVHDVADDDSVRWAELTKYHMGIHPDIVFTSEDYGDPWAEALGCRHILVDKNRETYPISATAIREDPLAHLEWLDPVVRAHYNLRVCFVGTESSGKTTLAARLAEMYSTVWVPEYGFEYTYRGRHLFNRFDKTVDNWLPEELLHIAQTQQLTEEVHAQIANRVLFCDTNVFATKMWHERLLGYPMEYNGQFRNPDIYVLCEPDFGFVQDEYGTRVEGPARERMHVRFKQELDQMSGIRIIRARGSLDQRAKFVSTAVEMMIRARSSSAREVRRALLAADQSSAQACADEER